MSSHGQKEFIYLAEMKHRQASPPSRMTVRNHVQSCTCSQDMLALLKCPMTDFNQSRKRKGTVAEKEMYSLKTNPRILYFYIYLLNLFTLSLSY